MGFTRRRENANNAKFVTTGLAPQAHQSPEWRFAP